ncbi:MAG: hypothetical protein KGH71_03660 [Candidatus Micrarchaeota archaeon]|nr:hypothetical protein [Candidatus Micrarchaeota archaeon]
MNEQTKEWIEIALWFVLPLIVLGIIAYVEYYAGNIIVAALFALLFLALLARRIIVAMREVEPILEAEKKEKNLK